MPQLVPFYFVNEMSFAFILMMFVVYLSSKYILPNFVSLFVVSTFMSKL